MPQALRGNGRAPQVYMIIAHVETAVKFKRPVQRDRRKAQETIKQLQLAGGFAPRCQPGCEANGRMQ